jgi:hypothetical protein
VRADRSSGGADDDLEHEQLRRLTLLLAALAALVSGCGGPSLADQRALLSEARPVGAGARFDPGVGGPIPGRCEPRLGRRYAVHVEVFAQNATVLVPAGLGTAAPRTVQDGQVVRARCYGTLVTLAPAGIVLVRDGAKPVLGALFRAWGEPLSGARLASFTGKVRVFVNGRRHRGSPGAVRLARHAEVVLEIGPHVPPRRTFTFPPGA